MLSQEEDSATCVFRGWSSNDANDWRSEGEIYQVWFHREFHGRLLQTAPITLDAGPALQTLLEGINIECTADTSIGLPNWSVTTGLCTLSRANGAVTIEGKDLTLKASGNVVAKGSKIGLN